MTDYTPNPNTNSHLDCGRLAVLAATRLAEMGT